MFTDEPMTTLEIIGMVLSLLGMCANIASFQARKKWLLLTLQLAGTTLFSAAFFCSGAGIGGIMNILLFIRTIVFMLIGERKGLVIYITWGVLIASYITGLMLFNFVFKSDQTTLQKCMNILPVLGGTIGTIAFGFSKMNVLRIIKLGDSACWLAFNSYVWLGALGGILCEVFSIGSIIIALIRFRDKKEKTDEQLEQVEE